MEGNSGDAPKLPPKTLSRRQLIGNAIGIAAASATSGYAVGRITKDTPAEAPATDAPSTGTPRSQPEISGQIQTEPTHPSESSAVPSTTQEATSEIPKTELSPSTNTSQESVNEATVDSEEIIEEEASPTATPTAEKKKKRTLKEILADADMDKEKMRELYNNNTRVITDPWSALADPKLSGEWLPDGFGSGWCLAGVRYSLQLSDIMIEDLKGIGSAYKAEAVFDSHPELFEKLNISRKSIPSLPPGTILVYEPNQDSDPGGGAYDLVDGVHHGHISILRGRNDQKEVLAGSDHEELLEIDMSLMHHKIQAYIIKNSSSAS
ncbi:MAG: hypothetical protein RLZZ455_858 [Candidatus Parcubacteria bacterium]|jgi:hypothetical protein